jgi:secreted trypsin-like serine protease
MNKAYLIDGVAINGVSGGPVIFSSDTDGVQFVGIVSAYRASRNRGEALPGLLVAQDVSHFHGVVQQVRTWDEANKKKAELEAAKSKEAAQPPIK